MCFSPEASFTVGAGLIPAGLFCIRQAVRINPRTIYLACIPLVFGIQQICEGFVWQNITGTGENLRLSSLAFLFFAIAFWPFWFPLVAAIMEPPSTKKWLFWGFAILSTFWLFAMYLPLVFGPSELLITRVERHSIQYYYPDLWIYQYLPKTPLRIIYFLMVALPMAFSSESLGKIPGLALGISAGVTIALYDYAFVSVWCFFAAVLSFYLVIMFYQLPNKEKPSL
ncbi:hypothetical protein KIH39_16390 [Telmatocola sphagniphila]|uniref:Uncharacterized protein n=1 Tax=Telmatocola sphagniphila TaxID=1123043 RepID=A0A8E6ETU7_9BACT|nr:DUF6629 family protein [Telmatocola sphagniphila]QVL30427.1 hypothetical protein KIH39_16390 [Telmatocola sphagniphila]